MADKNSPKAGISESRRLLLEHLARYRGTHESVLCKTVLRGVGTKGVRSLLARVEEDRLVSSVNLYARKKLFHLTKAGRDYCDKFLDLSHPVPQNFCVQPKGHVLIDVYALATFCCFDLRTPRVLIRLANHLDRFPEFKHPSDPSRNLVPNQHYFVIDPNNLRFGYVMVDKGQRAQRLYQRAREKYFMFRQRRWFVHHRVNRKFFIAILTTHRKKCHELCGDGDKRAECLVNRYPLPDDVTVEAYVVDGLAKVIPHRKAGRSKSQFATNDPE